MPKISSQEVTQKQKTPIGRPFTHTYDKPLSFEIATLRKTTKYRSCPSYRTKTMMNTITIVGLLAASFTTIALLPQLMKVWKTKSTRDISTGMFTLYSSGLLLWFIYGLYISNAPIIIANSLAFIQALVILIFKTKYK